MNLTDLPLKTEGIVEEINCKDNLHRRLLDLGLIKGCSIIPVYKSPFGDPIAYEIKKCLIAIRKEDGFNIKIKFKE